MNFCNDYNKCKPEKQDYTSNFQDLISFYLESSAPEKSPLFQGYEFHSIEFERPINKNSVVASRSFAYNETYQFLFKIFNERYCLISSKGKDANGSMSPFYRTPNTDAYLSKRQRVWLDSTHFKTAFEYTKKFDNVKHYFKGFNIIVIDIDDFQHDLTIFKKLNIEPNCLIKNPKKPKSLQAYYVLENPVVMDKYRKLDDDILGLENEWDLDEIAEKFYYPEPIIFKIVLDHLKILLNGDFHHNQYNSKNPFFATEQGSIAWTDQKPFNLFDLYEKLKVIFDDRLPKIKDPKTNKPIDITTLVDRERSKHKNYVFDENSRNCLAFKYARKKAYKMAYIFLTSSESKLKEFEYYVKGIIEKYNETNYKAEPLPQCEINAMARSIVLWINKHHNRDLQHPKFKSYNEQREMEKDKRQEYISKKLNLNKPVSLETKKELSKLWNVSVITIDKDLMYLRKNNKVKKDFYTEITALRENKTSWKRIAEIYNVELNTIKTRYKRAKSKAEK